ncbi:MAG: hypothetical protein FJ225_11070 [Lentisphaerae bacterium]|nr:hypothetical protein [Lentisphaerota bacterium]
MDQKYTAFIILTQSCDIARRQGEPCKSRYINLAVIRPLEDVLLTFLDTECDRVRLNGSYIEGLYVEESRYRADQLLSRILNQNEHGLGLFYLHADADVRIAVPSVALLQVSIALRREHYETLEKARSGRLTPEFQSRLGWIIGNLYSRVATRDWPPAQRKEVTEGLLAAGEQSGRGPMWITRANVRAAQEKGLKIKSMPLPDIVAEVQRHKPKPPMERATERVLAIVQEVTPTIEQNALNLIRNRLANDQVFESTFK